MTPSLATEASNLPPACMTCIHPSIHTYILLRNRRQAKEEVGDLGMCRPTVSEQNDLQSSQGTKKEYNNSLARLQKAFDSVLHAWIMKSVELARIPKLTIDAIKILMTKWRTKLNLYGETINIKSSFIDYLRGILQGDLLSLILFLPSVNPLSYLLSKEKGYTVNVTAKAKEISHLFLVDDLKLYASSLNKIMKLLDIVTQFTSDVGMKFGE